MSDDDPAVSALSVASRVRVGRLWAKRAQNELATSAVFAQLHGALVQHGAPLEVLELSAKAESDELRHFEICCELSEHYLCDSLSPALPVPPVPTFGSCSAQLERLFFATMQCCVNETIAAAYLQACLADATAVRAHDAVREILRDEVRHSRIGWALLADPGLSPEGRRAVAHLMPEVLELYRAGWLAGSEDYPEDLPRGHGLLTHRAVGSVVHAAIHDLILPGLDHVGVPSAPARAWFARYRWSA